MPELWFIFGLAMGIAVVGFCAIGSFERGAASVRLAPWRQELRARRAAPHGRPEHASGSRTEPMTE